MKAFFTEREFEQPVNGEVMIDDQQLFGHDGAPIVGMSAERAPARPTRHEDTRRHCLRRR
jgi:hypothetical protein